MQVKLGVGTKHRCCDFSSLRKTKEIDDGDADIGDDA